MGAGLDMRLLHESSGYWEDDESGSDVRFFHMCVGHREGISVELDLRFLHESGGYWGDGEGESDV